MIISENGSSNTSQSFKNHTRFDPLVHFVIFPILILNVFAAIHVTIHHWPNAAPLLIWLIIVSIVLFLLAGKTRGYALHNQDRIIRLEERLRLAAILSPADASLIPQLTEAQLVALRFAPDEELAALTHKTLTQNLEPKA